MSFSIIFDGGDRILAAISNLGASLMAKQQEALEAISTLHTHLTDAVARVNAFQQAQADSISQLKQQVADLNDKLSNGDFPDDVVKDIQAMQATADAIDPSPITPDPVPTPVDPNQPTPTPAPTPDQPAPPVDPNQPAPAPPA
jgi:uncharacterized phage infection (PIP) family protein YhgE